MKPRATRSLASLPDRELFGRLAEGMQLLAEHARMLEASVVTLRGLKQIRGAAPLRALAEEEAAKFLILLDVVRCDRNDQKRKSEQLGRFHNHLAKGIYERVCEIRPASYSEVRRFVDGLRQSHYLDGPNDFDWIFRNEIEAQREERLYVDFIDNDSGQRWHSPAGWDDVDVYDWPASVRLVGAMARAGFAMPDALTEVARLWRGFVLEDSIPWQEVRKLNRRTLEVLLEAGLAENVTDEDATLITEQWSFPLHSMEMSPIEVELEELRERQRNWDP